MYQRIAILTFVSLSFFSSCLIKPEDPEKDLWFPILETQTITPIRNIHAAGNEFYAISDDEFLRFDEENKLLERRPLLLPLRFFGRPALSDDAFIRVTRQNDNTQIIEVHSTKTSNQILDIDLNDLANPGEELISDANARYTGAFNATGDQYLLPCLSLPDYFFSCLLLDIKFNASRTAIIGVSVNRRINIPDLPADFQTLQNTRYIEGFYYLTSLDGTFRLSPTGDVQRIFREWFFDVFSHKGQLYATSAGGQLYTSMDNGLNWERSGNRATDLRYVESQNDQVFTHAFIGAKFQLSDETLLKANDIRYNLDFPDDLAAYNNIRFFNNRYYLTVQKQLFFTTDLQTID